MRGYIALSVALSGLGVCCVASSASDPVVVPPSVHREQQAEAAVVSPERHWLREASESYDFRVDVWRLRRLPSERLPGVHGEVTISTKSGELVQLVDVDLTNADQDARHYQPEIVSADFNFDGLEDFAIHDGFAGAYGAPSYSVYLFVKASRSFIRSDALSQLTSEGLGLFDVDAAHQRLTVHDKSGCCIHWKTEYALSDGQPIVMKRQTWHAVDGCRVALEVRKDDGTLARSERSCRDGEMEP